MAFTRRNMLLLFYCWHQLLTVFVVATTTDYRRYEIIEVNLTKMMKMENDKSLSLQLPFNVTSSPSERNFTMVCGFCPIIKDEINGKYEIQRINGTYRAQSLNWLWFEDEHKFYSSKLFLPCEMLIIHMPPDRLFNFQTYWFDMTYKPYWVLLQDINISHVFDDVDTEKELIHALDFESMILYTTLISSVNSSNGDDTNILNFFLSNLWNRNNLMCAFRSLGGSDNKLIYALQNLTKSDFIYSSKNYTTLSIIIIVSIIEIIYILIGMVLWCNEGRS